MKIAFNEYIEEIQPLAKTAEQKLKDKLLASGLSPKSFETGLRMMRAEAEIFTEENLPLLAEEQKLVTEYNKLIGSLTVMWDGEERTLAQMFPLFYETDRSIRQRAWEASRARLLKERQNINRVMGKVHGHSGEDRRERRYARLSRVCVETKIPL